MDEDDKYLSGKRVALLSPGFRKAGLYYDRFNSSVSLVETTYSYRSEISLPGTGFTSTSTVIIPNASFLEETYLHLELPNVPANISLPRGWGINSIREISYLWGSSNTSFLSYTGQSLMHILMSECETAEKCSEMLRLAGEAVSSPQAVPITADILLPMPWSSANTQCHKLGFDTSLLLAPIQVKVTFNNAEFFMGGSGTKPSAFSNASIFWRQGDLSDQSNSLRSIMMSEPNLYQAYPFIMTQSYTSPQFGGNPNSASSVQLLAFQNADLLGVVFSVVKVSDLASNGQTVPKPLNYTPIREVDVKFNGNSVYKVPGTAYRLTNMLQKFGGGFLDVVSYSGTNNQDFAPISAKAYPILIDFSRIRASTFCSEYQNVWRIGNNSMTVNFKTPDNDVYVLYATYFYNAINEVQSSTSNVYTA